MTHIKKHIALFLALCFIAVLPLTAAADAADVPTGMWYLVGYKNSKTGEDQSFARSELSTLYIGSSGYAQFTLDGVPLNMSYSRDTVTETYTWYNVKMDGMTGGIFYWRQTGFERVFLYLGDYWCFIYARR